MTFCKFCGQTVDTPCMDETDLHIYSRTIDRCRDASFAYEAENWMEQECREMEHGEPIIVR